MSLYNNYQLIIVEGGKFISWKILYLIFILLLISTRPTMGKINTGYLVLYNGIQCVGWSYIFYLFVPHFIQLLISGTPSRTLYQDIAIPLRIFQVAAYLEVLHNLGGLVKSSSFMTTLQVSSRVFLIFGMCDTFKVYIYSIIYTSLKF